MAGTTLCPHCNTRFRIVGAQLEAYRGMVRCGRCLQAFNAHPGFIPDTPDPQLELPMMDEPVASAGESPDKEPAPPVAGAAADAKEVELVWEAESAEETGLGGAVPPPDVAAGMENMSAEAPPAALLCLPPPDVGPQTPVAPTLAEQVAVVRDDPDREPPPAPRRWPWAVAAFLLLLALLAQAAYFFRIDLAARLPGLKPALTAYCGLLGCSVPLPQNTGLMSIESSDLEADPEHENQITLNALLRNRASYPQAFPSLELTLNDARDKPLARRIFRPKEYLPPQESEQVGLSPNHELAVKLYLGTADLRPTGYRLVLFYPKP